MRRLLSLLLSFIFVLFLLPVPCALAAQQTPESGGYAPGEALVLFHTSAPQPQVFQASSQPFFGSDMQIEALYDFPSAGNMRSAASENDGALSIALVSASTDTETLLARLDALDFVEAAEPNYRYYAHILSNDPYVDAQWNLGGKNGVHPDALWDKASSEDVIVAVLDTGVDYDTPDLAGRIDTAHAFDAYPSGGIPIATDTGKLGHGTHVAGIIAAATNNNEGVASVSGSSHCKIMPVRVFADNGQCYAGDVVAGIHHVIQMKQNGCNIAAANMSLGGKWFSSEIMHYALTKLGEAGVLPVRSAGNDKLYIDNSSVYPSLFENPYTVNVAAIREDGSFDGSYSNYSDTCVHIAAPGTDILSTWFKGRGGYVSSSGSIRFYPFEDTASYSIEYAPYHYQHHIVESDAVLLPDVHPSAGGYHSDKSLQFELTLKDDRFDPTKKYNDYRIVLPKACGVMSAGENLGLRVQVSAAALLGNDASLYMNLGERSERPNMDASYSFGEWYYLSQASTQNQELSLWLRVFNAQSPLTIRIDDLGANHTSDTAYHVFEGTSLAAPHAAGAYALLYAAMPDASLSELRARLLGSSRQDVSLLGKVNTGGSIDLRNALNADTSGFAPVIDSISQSGRSITVKGWFFGEAPSLTLAGKSIAYDTQSGSSGACTIEFTLSEGIEGVETLVVTKANGRSYRMRYDYSPVGNMHITGPMPETNAKDAILHDLFSYAGRLYYLVSTPEGYALSMQSGGGWSPFIPKKSPGDSAARDDFSTFVDGNLLYIYDIAHIHVFDMAAGKWLSDIAGPYTLDVSKSGFCMGAIAVHEGKLTVFGGKGDGVNSHIRVYDPNLGTWSDEGALDAEFTPEIARAVRIGGKLVIFAQRNAWWNQYAVFVFDGNTWTKQSHSYADLWKGGFTVLKNEILCLGDVNAKDGVLAYDPAANTWRRLPYWGTGLAHSMRGTVSGERFYAITALQEAGARLLQYLDFSSGGGGGGGMDGIGGGMEDFDLEAAYLRILREEKERQKPPAPPATSGFPLSAFFFAAAAILLFLAKQNDRRKVCGR